MFRIFLLILFPYALLLSFLDDPAPRFDLFGWRQGIVSNRGYYIAEPFKEAVT